MAALEAGDLHRHQVWVAGSELGRPDLVIGTGRVGGFPHIGDLKRVADYTGAHFLAEQSLQQVLLFRNCGKSVCTGKAG